MNAIIRPAAVLLLAFTVLTGLIYPSLVTAFGQVIWRSKANGSMLLDADGRPSGSLLIGQPFDDARDFWSRPSATGGQPYNARASSGSNLGPLSPALKRAVSERVAKLRASDPDNTKPIPIDLVTASGSGLDPHISPEGARWQIGRVARLRGVSAERIATLVDAHVEGRAFGILGEPRVNVLALNLALDALAPKDVDQPAAVR